MFVISDGMYSVRLAPAEIFAPQLISEKIRSRICIAVRSQKLSHDWLATWLRPRATRVDKSDVEWSGSLTSHPNSIAQAAAIEALKGPQESVGVMLAEYTAVARGSCERSRRFQFEVR